MFSNFVLEIKKLYKKKIQTLSLIYPDTFVFQTNEESG